MFNQNPMFSSLVRFNPAQMYSSFPGMAQSQMVSAAPNLMAGVKKAGFNWGGLLSGAQKTLNTVNQAIPIYNQAKPIWNNAKTMLKVFSEVNNAGPTNTANTTVGNVVSEAAATTTTSSSQPNFFA